MAEGWESPAERTLLISYAEKDNVLLRAADLYLRSARAAPNRPQAPRSLYAAGRCYLRVASYNKLFRMLNPERGYVRQANELFMTVVSRYPDSDEAPKADKLSKLLRGDEVYEGGEHPWGPEP